MTQALRRLPMIHYWNRILICEQGRKFERSLIFILDSRKYLITSFGGEGCVLHFHPSIRPPVAGLLGVKILCTTELTNPCIFSSSR